MERTEIEARINALDIAIRQTDREAMTYLENAVMMLQQASNTQNIRALDASICNQRKAWKDEHAELEKQLQSLKDSGEM